MGAYREAVADFLNGSDTARLQRHRARHYPPQRYGALKYGFGYNTEQEITENLRVLAASDGTRASTNPSPTPRSIKPSSWEADYA